MGGLGARWAGSCCYLDVACNLTIGEVVAGSYCCCCRGVPLWLAGWFSGWLADYLALVGVARPAIDLEIGWNPAPGSGPLCLGAAQQQKKQPWLQHQQHEYGRSVRNCQTLQEPQRSVGSVQQATANSPK